MADYKGIRGISIETIAGDPANPLVGQVWYNTTSNVLKCYKYHVGTGAWSSGTSSPVHHVDGGGAGTQTAYLAISGFLAPAHAGNQAYDGTTWTTVNSLVQKRYGNYANLGTQTACITAGGSGSPASSVEIYDGTCFTETVDVNRTTGNTAMGGAGTTTAGLVFKGNPGNVVLTETWNGTAWTEVNDSSNGSHGGFGIGTSTAALACGGNAPPSPPPTYIAKTETWDGTNWTEVADLNSGRGKGGAAGTQTAGLVAGGNPGASPGAALTEKWDGTSWTEVGDMGTARYACFGTPSGTTLAALVTGGWRTGTPGFQTTVEEWDDPTGNAVKTFTSS